MTEKFYHYSICLRTPKSPTKKLQKAFDEDEVYLDKELRAATYGRHLMIPTMAIALDLIQKAKPLIARRYGPEATMVFAYGGEVADQNTMEKFESHKKIAMDLLAGKESEDRSEPSLGEEGQS